MLFTYYDPHFLKNAWPLSGPTVGGTSVQVSGEGFVQPGVCDLRCRFSTHDVVAETDAQATDTNEVSCSSPSVNVPGDAILQVSLNGQ
jgi:hypothetical protein